MDLQVFHGKTIRPDVLEGRPHLPVPKRWSPWPPLRRLMARLEQQVWFLPAFGALFLLAALYLLSDSRPLPYGGWSVLGLFLLLVFLTGSLSAYIRYLQPRDAWRPAAFS